MMTGVCGKCSVPLMGWIGINSVLEPVEYNNINMRSFDTWVRRYQTDEVREHNERGMDVVLGSRPTEPYDLRPQAVY